MKASVLIIFCSIPVLSLAEEIPNYCYDEATNAKWESIAERAINNSDVIGLYNLRKALCVQIDKGFYYCT